MDGLADVLGDEIGGEGGLEAIDYAAECVGGVQEGLIMACVRYDDCIA